MFHIFILYALTTLPLSKQLLGYMSPMHLIGLRMTIGGTLLYIGYLLFSSCRKKIIREHIGLFAQVAFFALFLPYLLRYWGLLHAAQPRADLLYMTGPLFTYLLAGLIGIESFAFAKSIGLSLGYIGLLFYYNNPIHLYMKAQFGLADIAIPISILSLTYGWYIIRKLVVEHAYSPVLVHATTMLPVGLCALACSVVSETMTIHGNVLQALSALAALILVSNIGLHTLYAVLLKKYSLTFLQMCSFSMPLFVHIRQMLHGEASLSASFILAIIVIATSIRLFYIAENAAECNNFEPSSAKIDKKTVQN